MDRVPIPDLARDERVRVRAHLDDDTVERYRDATDLPPVVAFRVGGALILADGWHRVEAATLRGDSDIEADVRDGTIEDAVEWACLANVRHGRPLSRDERDEAIIKLWKLPKAYETVAQVRKGDRKGGGTRRVTSGWTMHRLAEEFHLTDSAINAIVQAFEARSALGARGVGLPISVAAALAQAPESEREAIADEFLSGGLERSEVVAAARVAREAEGGKPAPASAHEAMARVAARQRPVLTRMPDGSLVDADGVEKFGRLPTPEESANAAEIRAEVQAEAWMTQWWMAEDTLERTQKWAESEDFSSRPPAHLEELRLRVADGAGMMRRIVELVGGES